MIASILSRKCLRTILVHALALITFVCVAPQLWAAPPALSHVFPAGAQRGSKAAVTCTGTFSWPVSVWAPGLDVQVGAESGKLDINVAADLATDRTWIRLYNAEGASASFPFLIGSLPESLEQEPNNSTRDAKVLDTSNITINGVLASNDVDTFGIPLASGQTLVAAVDANTMLGSPMDAILQVATPEGTVLTENHDDVNLDPRLAFTATRTGTYVVRLFAFPAAPDTTIAFRGGANFIYRLTLTTGPFITHSVPLTAQQGPTGTSQVIGWNIPAGTKLPVVPLGGSRLNEFAELEPLGELRRSPEASLGFICADSFAGGARVRLVPHASVERSTDAQTPMALTAPISVTGLLQRPRQVDVYRLPLSKGQPIVLTLESRSIYLPSDPVVQLIDPAGNVAAEADDTGALRDAVITYTPAVDGDFQVKVADRYGHGNQRGFYCLTVRTEEPDFELSVAADAMVVKPDKPTEVPIKIVRRSTVGDITIEALGLPQGITAAPIISEAGKATAATVTLNLSTNGTSFSGPIRIVGKATQPKSLDRTARTPERLGAQFQTIWLTGTASP